MKHRSMGKITKKAENYKQLAALNRLFFFKSSYSSSLPAARKYSVS